MEFARCARAFTFVEGHAGEGRKRIIVLSQVGGEFWFWTYASMLRGCMTGLFLGLFVGWCLVDAWIWFDERSATPSDLSNASTKRLHASSLAGAVWQASWWAASTSVGSTGTDEQPAG